LLTAQGRHAVDDGARLSARAGPKPILFQPIYVGYERLVEGRSYTAELSGQTKKSSRCATC
jgi:glycerol-3-phosphate O-acyltransferase